MTLKYDTQIVSVCDNCVLASANGEWPDWETPEPLTLVPDGWHLIGCGQDCEPYFSHSRCDTCGAIAGSRHDATLMTIERVEVDE